MNLIVKLICLLCALAGVSTAASAQNFVRPGKGGPTLVWVTVRALPGEGLWSACRRHYQKDVYFVLGTPSNKVRCKIDHSRIYKPGERRQNFNQY